MKKIAFTALLVLGLFNINAFAQSSFFAGGSILSVGNGSRTQAYGWQASVAANPVPGLGVVADFGGQYRNGSSAYQYLFGPRVTVQGNSANGFVHALFGGARFGGGNNFAMGYGGGIDVPVSEGVAIRAIQFDWIPVRAGGSWETGVIRFGFGASFGQ